MRKDDIINLYNKSKPIIEKIGRVNDLLASVDECSYFIGSDKISKGDLHKVINKALNRALNEHKQELESQLNSL